MCIKKVISALAGIMVFAVMTPAPAKAVSSVNKAISLSDYTPVSGISGNLSSIGSGSLSSLMILWAKEFKRYHPGVNVQIQGAGSSTAAPALSKGTASLGPMSRRMKELELAAFEKHYGYPPTAVAVAIDALAIFVNKDNPIKGMTLAQVDAVFSRTRRCGKAENVTVWGDLGLDGPWQKQHIQLYGRNSVSGTYDYFKQEVLCDGDFKNTVNEQPGSASVVQAIGASIGGIGYSSMGYNTASVRSVPIAMEVGEPFFAATAENVINGTYPLSRYLYVYVNKVPAKSLPPIEREFFKLILSKQGQEAVEKDGYIPLPRQIVLKQMMALGLK